MKRTLIFVAVCVLTFVIFSVCANADYFAPSVGASDTASYRRPDCGLSLIEIITDDGSYHSIPVAYSFYSGNEVYNVYDDALFGRIMVRYSDGSVKMTLHAYTNISTRIRLTLQNLILPAPTTAFCEVKNNGSYVPGQVYGNVYSFRREIVLVDEKPSSVRTVTQSYTFAGTPATRLSWASLGSQRNTASYADSAQNASRIRSAPVFVKVVWTSTEQTVAADKDLVIEYTVGIGDFCATWYQQLVTAGGSYALTVTEDNVDFSDIGGFLDTSVGSFFDLQIFPHVSLGMIFFAILSILLIVIFLRIFAGG